MAITKAVGYLGIKTSPDNVCSYAWPDDGAKRVERFSDADLLPGEGKGLVAMGVEETGLPGIAPVQCLLLHVFALQIL